MWPFKPRGFARTVFYDPKIEAIRDPAAREYISRLQGQCTDLTRWAQQLENQLQELYSRLTWKVDIEKDASGRENPWLAAETARTAIKAPFEMKPEAPEGA